MASDRTTLTVSERQDFGSRTARRLRRSGLVPGVVYGGEGEPIAFEVEARTLRQALAHGGAVITLTVAGGGETPVVLKDQQRHPVTGDTMHIDLLRVDLRQKIAAVVVLELTGTEDAPGVKAGGVLEHVTRELTIRALPTAIPESIAADVSGMEINDTLQLSALFPPEGVEFVADEPDEVTIATLSPPRVEEEPEPEVEEEAELVGEEGEAAEAPEAPEAEPGAEAEGGGSEGE